VGGVYRLWPVCIVRLYAKDQRNRCAFGQVRGARNVGVGVGVELHEDGFEMANHLFCGCHDSRSLGDASQRLDSVPMPARVQAKGVMEHGSRGGV